MTVYPARLPTFLSTPRTLRLKRAAFIAAALILLVLAVLGVRALTSKKAVDPYRTAAVERGDLTRSVSASGTLQALVTVQVGSQVSGQIQQVMVDFNSEVHKGQVLATIDPQTYDAAVRQNQADLSASGAVLKQQDAALVQAQAQADVDLANDKRAKTMFDQGWTSPQALEAADAAYRRSKAGVELARAQIGAQQARVNQSAASLSTTQVNLQRTRIISPIDGVVVNRAIDPGQTVQASFQAPVLFQIAQDLSKLQVKIMVDEADIGQIQEGQQVRFTVDSYPDQNFTGTVTQVRKQPETQANVVAYAVIAEAANPGGRLLPGMTANADIVIQQLQAVTKVPTAALRFTPGNLQAPQQINPRLTGGGGGFGAPAGFGGGPPGGGGGGGQAQSGGRSGLGPQRMLAQLDLTKDQQAKADAIFAEMRQKMAGAAGDRDAARKMLQDSFARIDTILKPEQRQKLAALRAQFGASQRGGGAVGTVWVLRNKKPVSVVVRTGASDGSFTQVFGDIKPGDEAIVGGGPKPKVKAGASAFGPSNQQQQGRARG